MSRNPDKKYNITKPTELLDTYIHEISHAKYPKMSEKDIDVMVVKILASLSAKDKNILRQYIIKISK